MENVQSGSASRTEKNTGLKTENKRETRCQTSEPSIRIFIDRIAQGSIQSRRLLRRFRDFVALRDTRGVGEHSPCSILFLERNVFLMLLSLSVSFSLRLYLSLPSFPPSLLRGATIKSASFTAATKFLLLRREKKLNKGGGEN